MTDTKAAPTTETMKASMAEWQTALEQQRAALVTERTTAQAKAKGITKQIAALDAQLGNLRIALTGRKGTPKPQADESGTVETVRAGNRKRSAEDIAAEHEAEKGGETDG